MRGCVMSGRASRAALTANRSDSVPPLVTLPTTVGGADSSRAVAATTAFSVASSDGNAVGSSPLTFADSACADAARVSTSRRPES
jgi:hypothetical protein